MTPSKSKLEETIPGTTRAQHVTATPKATLFSPLQHKDTNTTTPSLPKHTLQSSSSTKSPSKLLSPPPKPSSKQAKGVAVRSTPARGRGSRGGRGSRSRGQGRSTLQMNTSRDVTECNTPVPVTAQANTATVEETPSHNTRSKRISTSLVSFDSTFRSIESSYAMSTLVLRHCISSDALRDMFK